MLCFFFLNTNNKKAKLLVSAWTLEKIKAWGDVILTQPTNAVPWIDWQCWVFIPYSSDSLLHSYWVDESSSPASISAEM